MVAAVIVSAKVPQPSASATAVLAYDRAHHTGLVAAGFLSFAASVPLAIWTATVYRRLRTLGITAPGAVIALAGGLLAVAAVSLSGLVTWTSAQAAPAAGPGLARALADLAFAAGAAGFIAPLGLLIAGVAVPSLIVRFVPRPLAWAGLVVARGRGTVSVHPAHLCPRLHPPGWPVPGTCLADRDERLAARTSSGTVCWPRQSGFVSQYDCLNSAGQPRLLSAPGMPCTCRTLPGSRAS
jgi:hypothetical protein